MQGQNTDVPNKLLGGPSILILDCFRVDDCPLKSAVVTCLISKPMELAKYFCSGKKKFDLIYY